MDIKTIAANYGGLSAHVIARAEENWRITRAKKSSGLDQFAGPVACIVVAACALNEHVDRTKLAKCAGASKRLIEPTVRKIVDAIEKKKSKHPLGPTMRTINSQDPVFVAACLYAVSKKAKMNVNQDKLLEAVYGNAKEFDAVVSSVEMYCQASLSGAIMDRKKRRKLAGDKASTNLVEQFCLQQLEEEERAKRQRISHDDEIAQTLAQQRVFEKLRASRVGISTQSHGLSRKGAAVATPEEYAEWRTKALKFMHNKKEKAECRKQQQ
ncbi:unnamed protein product [Peronospora farinosa]|uniref:ORC6 second cyclin-like domain-containing protein n=1 Tax=Peronospora farinosa TaxID=134698 RepID=A0ABN8BWW5_9STRA|nr:unnamed protein product [Peronospora farinosa]